MTQPISNSVTIQYPNKPVVFIMGPTASGKTALAMALYKTNQFEIISVDSALIYQQMDIGSAKPTKAELDIAPHLLIDFLDPKENYSAANFVSDARNLINQIHERGKIPLLTGGTMLYFKALRDGLADLPEADLDIRTELDSELKQEGVESIHAKLALVDSVTAERLAPTDTQRILRALEVYRKTGKPLSIWHHEQVLDKLPNPIYSYAIAPKDRAVLHQRIAQRFKAMISDGFLDEVRALHSRGDLNLDMPSIRCVGYRQMWMHLNGELSFDEAIERGIIATRQLAKRQFTWLRRWQGVRWVDSTDGDDLAKAEREILALSQKS